MIKFLAILKDSYREAMDAKTVYILAVLAAILIVLTASISFTPVGPSEAFGQIIPQFSVVFPDRGKGKIPLDLSGAVVYSASDARKEGDGYALRLQALGIGRGPNLQGPGPIVFQGGKNTRDWLRFTVANWLKPSGAGRSYGNGGPLGYIELERAHDVTPQEEAAVTTEQMQEFIKSQFAVHAGMSDVTVKRVTEGVPEPTYAFDVTVRNADTVRGWPQTTKLFFGSTSLGKEFSLGLVLWFIEEKLVNGFMAGFTILIGIIITGFFIPNMLRKGALDLLITKPISRPALLVYKYIGGLNYVFVLTAATVGGMWLVLALRSGYWEPTFLLLIPIITFMFAILYAFSTLIAVLTRSALASILLTCVFGAILFIVGSLKIQFDEGRAGPARDRGGPPDSMVEVVDALHLVLPRYKDIDRLTTKLITDGTLTPLERYALTASRSAYPTWAESIGVSLVFIVICLALASWRFNTRDG